MEPNETVKCIEPTKEEIRNGWTRESLTIYIKSRQQAGKDVVMRDPFLRRGHITTQSVNTFDPLKW